MICEFIVNYMEIQDLVELSCISLLWYTWNDTENVLENCEIVLEKVLEKWLIFFLETYAPHGNAYDIFKLLGCKWCIQVVEARMLHTCWWAAYDTYKMLGRIWYIKLVWWMWYIQFVWLHMVAASFWITCVIYKMLDRIRCYRLSIYCGHL